MARIVQLVCSDGFAGVERHVAGLSAGLAESGHEVVLLGGDHDRMPRAAGPAVIWRPADTMAAGVRELLGGPRPDLVHAHMTEAELAAVLAWPRHRAPIVSTRHFSRARGSSRGGRVAAALIRRRLAAQISVSGWVAGMIGEPSVVVPAGVAPPALGGVAPPAPTPQREPVVLVVSRLEAEKRVDLALGVWRDSGLAEAGWRLDIAGDGAMRASLQEQAQRLGIAESCRFLGTRDDVPRLLDTAGMLLATCPIEAFGLAVVEAMGHALPVVAVRGGGHGELLAPIEDAALFDPDAAGAGGRLLAALAADPQRRAQYGAALRELQRSRYSLDAQVEGTLAVYRDVLGDVTVGQ